ncbi:15885_t:CDS:2, partial [Gigaspora rosea]
NEKKSAEVNLFWVRYSIAEWKDSIDDGKLVDVLRCPYTNLRRAFSLCTTKDEIDALIKFANSLGPDEKAGLKELFVYFMMGRTSGFKAGIIKGNHELFNKYISNL